MLQRHAPLRGRSAPATPTAPNTRIALWKCVRRDPDYLNRSQETVERLALRLHRQAARARLRSDYAQELRLPNLKAADRWWKRQWRQGEEAGR
jgi:hypothetical protein